MNKAEFIDIVMQNSNFDDESDIERIVVAVFHVLRSQLSSVEHHDILYALPEDLESLWEGGWLQRFISRIQGLRVMDKDDFIEQVRETADIADKAEAEEAIRAVFIAFKSAIPKSETKHVHNELTNGVLDMWDAA
jgi:nucleoid DNA-binding protein